MRLTTASASLDLASCSVFIDFDGTISADDVGMHVLERLASPGWREIDDHYERGEIGSRQYVTELWGHLSRVPMQELLTVAKEVPLDPGTGSLVSFLRAAGSEVSVISDGLGYYVADRCAPLDIDVLANDVRGGRPTFAYADPTCPCGLCGTCKTRPVRDARARERTTVVVGDGTSDRHAAAVADVVFAKDRLVAWCEASSVPYLLFARLADVEASLRRLAQGKKGRAGSATTAPMSS